MTRYIRAILSNHHTSWRPLLTLAWMLLLLGCADQQHNPDGRKTVKGKITLNGKPLGGMAGIAFTPVDGGDGGGRGQIKDGHYILTGYDGIMPGKYIVRIFATVDFDKTTGKIGDHTLAFGNEFTVDIIPPEFNRESTIEYEVVENGSNVFNYDVQTDYIPKMPESPQGKGAVPL